MLAVLRSLPRHLFIDEALASRAYENNALPIGHGQTISQPWVVAKMTEALLRSAPKRVLEVGTGSGYQAAVLAALGVKVYTGSASVTCCGWRASASATSACISAASTTMAASAGRKKRRSMPSS